MDNSPIKDAGLKVTTPRVKVLEIFEQSPDEHLTAESVYSKLKDMGEEVGLATVYRVLTQFEEAGLVIRHHFEGGQSVFELKDDEHHDHLVCVQCQRVEEFVDDVIEARQEQIAKAAGFKLVDHNLHLYGICPECQKQSK